MLNPIPNLPVLIGHHKHPFTKQEDHGGIRDVCVCAGGRGSTRQGSPKWLTLDKVKTRIMPSLSSTVSTNARDSIIARARLS